MNAAWQQREEAMTHLRTEPHNCNLRKAVKMVGNNLRKVRKAAVLSFFWDFVRKLETGNREGEQAGFYKHLKTITLEGKRDRSSAYVKDKNGLLLRDVELIRERWSGGSRLSSTQSHRGLTRTWPKALTSGPRACR